MSRSGYVDDMGFDGEQWAHIRWRGAVKSAIRGRRGQAFLRDLAIAMDALPEKRLIAEDLILKQDSPDGKAGDVCALGALGVARKIDMSEIDPYDACQVAPAFDIAEALAREVVYVNDEDTYMMETPEARFIRVRKWVESQIRSPK